MLNLKPTTQFKKDYKKIEKSGSYDINDLKEVIVKLQNGEILTSTYFDHPLRGEWKDHRDCHIKDDWILIYRIDREFLILARTGSHSKLFKKKK